MTPNLYVVANARWIALTIRSHSARSADSCFLPEAVSV